MQYVADLHIHSWHARGTSPQLTLENLASWAAVKGIDLLATGDFTHPEWLAELRSKLAQAPDGLFALKAAQGGEAPTVRFLLGTEVSCVYPQGGRSRRVHLLVYAPGFDAVDRICRSLSRWGDLASDGRPTLSLPARDLVEVVLEADPRCMVVPAHVWTPWYSVYGSIGGFDSLAECFGDMLPHLLAVETGLSSDPAMNWRVPDLDKLTIVSFSDAHSLNRLGREATVIDGEMSYEGFRLAMEEGRIAYTVEFHPAEGKYHFDGHRQCRVRQSPQETFRQGVRCPRCGRRLTLGVAHRLERLAGRGVEEEHADNGYVVDRAMGRPPFKRLAPLQEVLAEVLSKGAQTKGVQATYHRLVQELGPELTILQGVPLERIAQSAGERLAEGVGRVRDGLVEVEPGYDGVYGTVHVWPEGSGGPSQARML